MSANISRGQTFGQLEQLTNTKLHNLVDLATISGIVNSEVASGAAIAYSKLSLTGGVVNADVNSAAAIVDTKLATISTAGKVNISALIATSQAAGDVIFYSSTATAWTRLPLGTAGQTLTVNAGATSPNWA